MIRTKTLAVAVAFSMLTILSRHAAAGTSTPAELIAATADAFRSKNSGALRELLLAEDEQQRRLADLVSSVAMLAAPLSRIWIIGWNKFGAEAMTSSIPPGLGTRMVDVTVPIDEWVMFEQPEAITIEETGDEAVATSRQVREQDVGGGGKATSTTIRTLRMRRVGGEWRYTMAQWLAGKDQDKASKREASFRVALPAITAFLGPAQQVVDGATSGPQMTEGLKPLWLELQNAWFGPQLARDQEAWAKAREAQKKELEPVAEGCRKLVTIMPEPLKDPVFEKVFSASLYSVEFRVPTGEGGKTRVVEVGGEIRSLEDTYTSKAMPVLLAALRPDLRIQSDADAETVRSALMRLYKVSGGDKKVERTVLHSGNEWSLITGSFFEKWKGFVLRTDEEGKVVQIEHRLDIEHGSPPAAKTTIPSSSGQAPATVNQKPAQATKPVPADIAKAGQTIGDIYASRDGFAGAVITVRGRVVKFDPQIMGKNWIRLRDGTGSAGAYELTITTVDIAKVGDTVLVTGKVTLNKDFGKGYKYDRLIEDAKVQVEGKRQ